MMPRSKTTALATVMLVLSVLPVGAQQPPAGGTSATPPSGGPSSGTAPGNSGSSGWTGGLGGSNTGTSAHGSTSGSSGSQPETVTGVDPKPSGEKK